MLKPQCPRPAASEQASPTHEGTDLGLPKHVPPAGRAAGRLALPQDSGTVHGHGALGVAGLTAGQRGVLQSPGPEHGGLRETCEAAFQQDGTRDSGARGTTPQEGRHVPTGACPAHRHLSSVRSTDRKAEAQGHAPAGWSCWEVGRPVRVLCLPVAPPAQLAPLTALCGDSNSQAPSHPQPRQGEPGRARPGSRAVKSTRTWPV